MSRTTSIANLGISEEWLPSVPSKGPGELAAERELRELLDSLGEVDEAALRRRLREWMNSVPNKVDESGCEEIDDERMRDREITVDRFEWHQRADNAGQPCPHLR